MDSPVPESSPFLRAVVLDVASEIALDAGPDSASVFEKDVAQVLREIGYTDVEVVPLRNDARKAIAQIRRRQKRADVFVNLYDLADETGQKIVDYMESNGIAFTGAGSRFYDPPRDTLKRVCRGCGVGTAPYVVCIDSADISETAVVQLGGFPLFVKPEHGYDSVGIDSSSKVADLISLKARVDFVAREHGGALIEPYIEGREFSVLVLGGRTQYDEPIVFTPVEYVFPATRSATPFITFDDKWGSSFECRWKLLDSSESDLIQGLQTMAKKLFMGFEADGYGRADIRQDRVTGKLYVLDMNPNCSLFYTAEGTADTILRLCGWSKARFLRAMIDQGKARAKLHADSRAVEVVYTEGEGATCWQSTHVAGRGNAILAARDLQPGDMIQRLEEQPHRLVSWQHVQKYWPERSKSDFAHYAYPVGENTFAYWDADPLKWRPINHSCDPNAWLDGLNMVARRAIAKGEEVTIDYATFCTTHPAFECWCGSELCRREKCLQPGECTQSWFIERYAGHCSPHVESLMQRAIKSNSN